MGIYQVRRVTIGKTDQLDQLARECGRLYSQTVVSFWRTVRHKGLWLKPKHLMRWHTSNKLHAHTADACVQTFFASLKSWRERKKAGDPDAKPPRKRKRYFRMEYKRSAMSLKEGKLRLSNGKGNDPLVLEWPWDLPQTVVIHWTGTQYEAIATYQQEQPYGPFPPGKVAGVDLGEVQMAVAHDGIETHLLNGRLLRSKVQYRNKLQAKLNSRIDGRMKKGSKRRKRLIRSKKRQLAKLKHQIRDIEHKGTTRLISTLHENGVQTVVIGDVRDIRQDNDVGSKNNQKLHQWVRPKCSFCIVPRGTTGGEKPYGERTYRRWKRHKGTKHVRKAARLEISRQTVLQNQGVIWSKLHCLTPSFLAFMDGVYEELIGYVHRGGTQEMATGSCALSPPLGEEEAS
jgi:putative transposase